MNGQHVYKVAITWTGNKGEGTVNYKAYDRSHTIAVENKSDLPGSSDPAFRGDKTKHNPEDLLVSSLSACHMLWYLHLCAEAGVVVTAYSDKATGTMVETPEGGGHFVAVTLNPEVTVTEAWMVAKAEALHQEANKRCFIANSVNFPVHHHPVCNVLKQ
ncbi:peroxiredoxin [Adhaeribacter aerolatus]|uniref:Peroxiredoxin n=1 Tax=Adhaeribacter aerolatus TaxID=670289 RepID=A0A512B167_9BACT|nr:OsmC family protein [Adhaeribacter aerolatus]GEO05692.1 peroxiredoxin [Adhaeribacter aerolatus]